MTASPRILKPGSSDNRVSFRRKPGFQKNQVSITSFRLQIACCVIGCLLTATNTAVAQPAPADNTAENTVQITGIQGNLHTGPLRNLTPEAITFEGPPQRPFALSDVFKVEFPGRKSLHRPQSESLLLANGDRLFVTPISMDDEVLLVKWQSLENLRPFAVPLEAVRAVIPAPPAEQAARNRLMQTLLASGEEHDVLFLANGNRIRGELLALDLTALKIHSAVGETIIPKSSVQALAFNTELMSFPPPTSPTLLLSLTDGTTITATSFKMPSPETLRLQAAFGAELEIPLSSLRALRFLGDRVIPLSDLEPADVEFTPFLSTTWPLRKNRNVLSGPLRLRGKTYPLGLGMHSRIRVTYNLGGDYRRFLAAIGIDDSADGLGSALFAVEVGLKRVFTSGPLTGKDPPQSIEAVDLRGAEQLTLIVDFGPQGDIRDHADWCDAVLIKP